MLEEDDEVLEEEFDVEEVVVEPDLKVGTTSQPLQSLQLCVGAHPTFPFVSHHSLFCFIPSPHLLLVQSWGQVFGSLP